MTSKITKLSLGACALALSLPLPASAQTHSSGTGGGTSSGIITGSTGIGGSVPPPSGNSNQAGMTAGTATGDPTAAGQTSAGSGGAIGDNGDLGENQVGGVVGGTAITDTDRNSGSIAGPSAGPGTGFGTGKESETGIGDSAGISGRSQTSSPFNEDAGAPGLSGVTDGGGGPDMNGSSSATSVRTGIGGSATNGNTSISGNTGSTVPSGSTGVR